jgi:hypothetical protein
MVSRLAIEIYFLNRAEILILVDHSCQGKARIKIESLKKNRVTAWEVFSVTTLQEEWIHCLSELQCYVLILDAAVKL